MDAHRASCLKWISLPEHPWVVVVGFSKASPLCIPIGYFHLFALLVFETFLFRNNLKLTEKLKEVQETHLQFVFF